MAQLKVNYAFTKGLSFNNRYYCYEFTSGQNQITINLFLLKYNSKLIARVFVKIFFSLFCVEEVWSLSLHTQEVK